MLLCEKRVTEDLTSVLMFYLNSLNKFGKRDKMRVLPNILSFFRNEFNKFNNTGERILDSVYHMTLNYF